MRETLGLCFKDRYHAEPQFFFAPGRVNLMGEHTDYNDGFVLPMALPLGTLTAAGRRADRRIRAYSMNLESEAEVELDAPGQACRGLWIDYVEGMARILIERGISVPGANLAVASTLPLGAGLSSSASLEISVGLALLALSGSGLDPLDLARSAQEAEHRYVGARCGIMDQMAALLGKEGHALLIDCRSLEVTPIPFNLSGVSVILCNSKKKHALASSAYNDRRRECEEGLRLLQEIYPAKKALRDVTLEELANCEERLPETIRRRCRHVVSENERTLEFARRLQEGDAGRLGELFYESHQSLRQDYEVSCRELDWLVEMASSVPGVIGARMTGGGFGGCTVNLVRDESLAALQEAVMRRYRQKAGLDPEIYTATAGAFPAVSPESSG